MSGNSVRQGFSVAPRVPETQAHLVITSAPDAARGLVGQSLKQAGAISVVGTYQCEIITEGWALVSAHVKVSAVTGTVRPTLITKWLSDNSTRDTTGSTDFIANTQQDLTLTDLNGQRRAYLSFDVGAAESVTFSRGEFNGQ
jgi:hypothetical protein